MFARLKIEKYFLLKKKKQVILFVSKGVNKKPLIDPDWVYNRLIYKLKN